MITIDQLVDPYYYGESLSTWLLLVTAVTVLYVGIRISTDPEAALPYKVPEPDQCKTGYQFEQLSDPSVKIPGSSAIRCYNPATGEALGLVNPSSPDGIDRAIARASEAQKEWCKTSFAQRRRVLKTLLRCALRFSQCRTWLTSAPRFVLQNKDIIAQVACLDSGKTKVDAGFGEILVTTEKLQWTILHGEQCLRPERRPTNFLMAYKTNRVQWEPLGIVAACVSWNYPFHNFVGPIISAIFSGNAIVVKCSEQTAWSTAYFAKVVQGALQVCGHSPQLVQSIACWPSVAPHLTSHPGISHLTFIGSREIAQQVAASAAKSLTPLCLELGGKDPVICLDDITDLDRVIATLIRGVFQSAGQNCVGIERICCLPTLYPVIVARMEHIISQLRSGCTDNVSRDEKGTDVDVGACISNTRFDELDRLIRDAVNSGARLLHGGRPYKHPLYPHGHYYTPTLLVDVTTSMEIAQVELFAPVALLMRAASIDDALRIANGTMYGLGSSVFGTSSADIAYVVNNLQAGMVAVNDFAVYYAVQLPFGGVKGSGYGRFAGQEGLRSLCAQKAICQDWVPGVRTSIPRPLRIPYPDAEIAWSMAKGIIDLGYGDTWWRRIQGLVDVVQASFR